MADISVTGFDEVIKKLDRLSNKSHVDEIGKHMVDAAVPITESAMVGAIASVEYGPYSTGSVSGSIKTTPSKVNAYGAYAVARPTGRDGNGERNGAKAAFLQYGTQRMAARPWREKAVNSSKASAESAMEQVLKEEMELD